MELGGLLPLCLVFSQSDSGATGLRCCTENALVKAHVSNKEQSQEDWVSS